MQKTSKSQPNAKETRISMRINEAQKAVIARAAKLKNTTLTDFVLENAYQAASLLISEQTHIEMTPEQFEKFCKLLDAPPAKNLKAMRKLLNEPSILDD